MPPDPTPAPTPVLSITRWSMLLFFPLSAAAAISLYVLSTRTADYFAWTIASPLTAAFLGAGYLSSLPTLVLALREREWQRVRLLMVLLLIFTAFMGGATLRHLDRFHLDDGPAIARTFAWVWLVVYVVTPPLILACIVLQERAGGRRDYVVGYPLLRWARVFLVVQAAFTTVLGLGLAFAPTRFAELWPWPLTELTAQAIASAVLATAAGTWWALREGDWRRIRVHILAFLLIGVLHLIAALRFRGSFGDDDLATRVYLGAIAVAFALTVLASWQQERLLQRDRPIAVRYSTG